MPGFGRKKKGKRHSVAVETTYDGIKFKSKLEVYCYKALKKAKIPFDYEVKKYTLIDGFKPGMGIWTKSRGIFKARKTPVRPITYTPDFVCTNDKWVIETKGYKSEGFKFRWKLFIRYLHRRDLTPEVFMPTSYKEVDEVIKTILELRQHDQD